MSAICPNGHTSAEEDYCDVCGEPIAAASVVPTPEPGPAVAEPDPVSTASEPCPHCGAPAAPLALFCENCGYDFTTGSPPQSVGAGVLPMPVSSLSPSAEQDPAPAGGAGEPEPDPGGGGSEAEGSGSGPAAEVEAEEPDGGVPEGEPSGDPGSPEPGGPGDSEPVAENSVPTPGSGLPTPPAPGPHSWVAELWVDPDWYADQAPEDPMPSPGSPTVIPLRDLSILVGRPSQSRGIRPQVNAGADNGVSRRHCQLSTDGVRWWVEDLDSANGTFVSRAGDPLPTDPLLPGIRHELDDGERIFIGGWTRLVVRKALPGEV